MKSHNSKKPARPSKQAASYLAARAAEAEKQAANARKVARLAKAKLKQARKVHKQAKKFAKQARKEAKAAAKTLKQQLKHTTKTRSKKASMAAAVRGKTTAQPTTGPGSPAQTRKVNPLLTSRAPAVESAPTVAT